MTPDFRWGKLRLPAETWTLLNRAVDSLNQNININFHMIKQPFGRIIACQIADVWLFHVGDGGRPPRIWTLAVAANPGQRLLLPAQRAEDFDECCDLLQLQSEE